MAYGYKAHYGYYIDPTGTQQGVVTNLEGVNISDCVITDENRRFYIAETYELVKPKTNTSSSDRAAMRTRMHNSMPDWRYMSMFPAHSALSGINDQDIYQYLYWGNDQITLYDTYDPFQIEKVNKVGNMFYYCRNLCKKMVSDLHGKKACTFVYLYNQHKLIDQSGNLYSVGSNGLITRVLGTGNYAASYQQINSYTNNVAQSYTFFFHVWHETVGATTYTRMGQGRINVNAGSSLYNWTLWSDADQCATNVSTILAFYGFDTGGYDYKSEIGKSPDPYTPGGKSDTGGGGGTGEIPAPQPTPIPGIADLPTAGMILNMYEVTYQQLQDLHSDLWSSGFINTIGKMMFSPIDNIVACLSVPYDVDSQSSSSVIVAGDFPFPTAKGYFLTSQYKEIDCGIVHLSEIWGSYLDYHCRISLYLPFIGSIMLQAEDVVDHDLSVKYVMDNLTGSCLAYVFSDAVLIGQYGGNCGYMIPLTGSNYNSLISNIISMTTAAAATVASAMTTGGITAPIAAADAATALNVATSKKDYQRTGGLGGSNAAMNCRYPYLTVYCPNLCAPDNQNAFTGYPAYITAKLSEQSGYTEVYKCHITASGASDAEIAEIEMLLKEGVYIL